MTALTDEQRARIEANRKRALELQKQHALKEPRVAKVAKVAKVGNQPVLSNFTNTSVPQRPVNAIPPQKPGVPFNPLQGYVPNVTIEFEACSPTQATIKISMYMEEIKRMISAYKSAVYNGSKKLWTIGLDECPAVVADLKKMKTAKCTIVEMPPWVRKVFARKRPPTQTPEEIEAQLSKSEIDPCLLKKLFPYQKAGVAYGLQRNGKVMIADEMGLGKSLQALAIARAYPSEWPLLIVCPSSVKYSWKQQIQQFLPHVDKITVIEKGTDQLPRSHSAKVVVIMSYEQMVIKLKALLENPYQVVIFDESHLLKERTARRTKVAKELSAGISRLILLSGTPALSRPSELFTQIGLIDAGIFTTWKAFAQRYCDLKKGKFGPDAKGAEHLDELAAILQHSVMIRRFKKDVLDDLPAKTREILYLSGDKIKSKLKELKLSREAQSDAEKSMNSEDEKEHFMTYFSNTGLAKAESVADWVLETYFYKEAAPIKILLFAHHTSVLDKIKTIRIDGHTKGPDRGAFCKSFQEDPSIKVAILSITAAGTGITLTAANKVIFAELYWNPGTFFQAEDRAHRVGQKSAVNITYVLARKTADDMIWPKIQEKIMVIGNLKLNREDLSDLDNTERVINGIPEGQLTIRDFFTIREQQ
ncbi:putative SMARCAL1-like protein [Aphelenchoides bicaudatus]|nr:putative SMARCAL1-like protein [Aphelenchoides bicaudatus]